MNKNNKKLKNYRTKIKFYISVKLFEIFYICALHFIKMEQINLMFCFILKLFIINHRIIIAFCLASFFECNWSLLLSDLK